MGHVKNSRNQLEVCSATTGNQGESKLVTKSFAARSNSRFVFVCTFFGCNRVLNSTKQAVTDVCEIFIDSGKREELRETNLASFDASGLRPQA